MVWSPRSPATVGPGRRVVSKNDCRLSKRVRVVKDYFHLTVNYFLVDTAREKRIMQTMKTFYDLIGQKEIRDSLIKAGFKQSTISMWKHKQRFPLYENAKKIADVLHIPLKRIPWSKVQRNEP